LQPLANASTPVASGVLIGVPAALAVASGGRKFRLATPQSGRVEAVVVRKPFVDPEKEVPKQQVTATAGAKTTSRT
jgi:hypothetical protein